VRDGSSVTQHYSSFKRSSQVWWFTRVITELGRLRKQREEDRGYMASLGYMVKPCLNKYPPDFFNLKNKK
jgi:hypothetical protein